MNTKIQNELSESAKTMKLTAEECSDDIASAAKIMIEALKTGKKVLACGNGGSAAQAQHFVAELVVRFEKERKALPGITLSADTSNVTATGNDYGYEHIFSRQVEALGQQGDVLVGLTTSGNSPNIIKAFEAAKARGMKTILLSGRDGGKLKDTSFDAKVIIPHQRTAHIQEAHIAIIHIWCGLVDDAH